VNVYLVLLAATVLNILFSNISFSVELFTLTGFLSLFLLFYAIGFPIAFLVRAGMLYKKLK